MNSDEVERWKARFNRERLARKESEALLEKKSMELWEINKNLERQITERTLLLEKALLESKNSDNAKSIFLANMSHEIRTPLNGIVGFSQILANSSGLSAEDAKHARIIESSANTLLEIINDILDISKIESGNFDIQPVECSLYDIGEEVVDLFLTRAWDKKIRMHCHIDKAIAKWIVADDVRLRQVFSNLIGNAIKFTPEMGEVALRMELVSQDEHHTTINFEIRDSGIGIPHEKFEHIFKPFTQVDSEATRKFQGTGLGLSICSHLVRAMGGAIGLDSEVGSGSSFYFTLTFPISQRTHTQKETNHYTAAKNHQDLSGVYLLVAEDNPSNQELIKYYLEELGCRYCIVDNGEKAFVAYCEASFDMVLMDINMPVLDGIGAFKKIRAWENEHSKKNTPVIALTANAIKGDRERFLSEGMDGYLSKPIDHRQLQDTLYRFALNLKEESNLPKKTLSPESIDYFDAKRICERLKINEKLANMFIDRFVNDIQDDMKILNNAMENEDISAIKFQAHYIKNSCINVAFDEAIPLLQLIENSNTSLDDKKVHLGELQMLVRHALKGVYGD